MSRRIKTFLLDSWTEYKSIVEEQSKDQKLQ